MVELRDRQSYIYFLYAEKANAIKIGYSVNLEERFTEIQSHNAEDLDLLKVVSGDLQWEKALHKQFRKYRLHHEWYVLNTELLDLIDSLPWSEYLKK